MPKAENLVVLNLIDEAIRSLSGLRNRARSSRVLDGLRGKGMLVGVNMINGRGYLELLPQPFDHHSSPPPWVGRQEREGALVSLIGPCTNTDAHDLPQEVIDLLREGMKQGELTLLPEEKFGPAGEGLYKCRILFL